MSWIGHEYLSFAWLILIIDICDFCVNIFFYNLKLGRTFSHIMVLSCDESAHEYQLYSCSVGEKGVNLVYLGTLFSLSLKSFVAISQQLQILALWNLIPTFNMVEYIVCGFIVSLFFSTFICTCNKSILLDNYKLQPLFVVMYDTNQDY